jgi:hypothetical protein
MKPDLPGGFALVLAALTLAVAVLSGIFLVYQPDSRLQAGAPPELPATSPVQVLEPGTADTDHLRAKQQRVARAQRPHRGKSG